MIHFNMITWTHNNIYPLHQLLLFAPFAGYYYFSHLFVSLKMKWIKKSVHTHTYMSGMITRNFSCLPVTFIHTNGYLLTIESSYLSTYTISTV